MSYDPETGKPVAETVTVRARKRELPHLVGKVATLKLNVLAMQDAWPKLRHEHHNDHKDARSFIWNNVFARLYRETLDACHPFNGLGDGQLHAYKAHAFSFGFALKKVLLVPMPVDYLNLEIQYVVLSGGMEDRARFIHNYAIPLSRACEAWADRVVGTSKYDAWLHMCYLQLATAFKEIAADRNSNWNTFTVADTVKAKSLGID